MMQEQDTEHGMSGAEALVKTLLAGGVEVCFTNPGTSEMHFVAALDRIPGMRSVLTLFEGVATGAADGYYRMARKPASTLLHLGPGLANGLANLHNAKKAGSGVVNIVGEHAASHIALDAPLTADIEGIARPMSHWVRTSPSAREIGEDAAQAIQAARTAPGQVATLILPSDTAWTTGAAVEETPPPPALPTVDSVALAQAVRALDGPGSLLLLGHGALGAETLEIAGQIAAHTGCALLSEWSNPRMERGAGRVPVGKVPYPIDLALEAIAPFERIVLVGARAPIGFFAYPGKPAHLTRPDAEIVTLAEAGGDIDASLAALCREAGAEAASPHRSPRVETAPVSGPCTADTLPGVLARVIPENGIIVDESVTTGREFFAATHGAAPHTWLNNNGGSIGFGLPVAIGAAIACPDRKVLAMIGDGSAMYTVQALWTMAREGLDVTVMIFANRSYQILRGELAKMGAGNPGPRAVDMLTLDRPDIGWTALAQGMGVEATRVEDCAALEQALCAGLETPGPYLVEVMM